MTQGCRRILTNVTLAWLLGLSPAIHAQSPASSPQFEVASIKPNTGGGRNRMIRMAPGGRLNVENLPLKFLVRIAYDVKEFQISGGPSWIDSDSYDVTAKAESNFSPDEMRPMLQALLADRFKLAIHRETKEAAVYELTAAKGGIKLAASKEGSCTKFDPKSPPPALPRPGDKPPNFCGNIRVGRGLIDASGITMDRFLMVLSDMLGRTTIDKTGFTGNFDVHLEFTPDEATPGAAFGPAGPGGPGDPGKPVPSGDSTGPNVFTALQEQLGLRAVPAKGQVEMLVIDHVERPSEN
jgi:uncharacterized protein (TIGR03435 family)